MSLRPASPNEIPPETARIAKASFPKGNFCLKMRDKLGTIYQDEQFSPLFAKERQPALASWRLSGFA